MATRDWFSDMRAIRDCSASPETKHLLLVLYTFCRQDSCWPSQATIGVALGIGVRGVQLRLNEAKAKGWIKIEQRWAPNGQTSNRYILNVDRAIEDVGAPESAQGEPQCASENVGGAPQYVPPTNSSTSPPRSPVRPSELPSEQPVQIPIKPVGVVRADSIPPGFAEWWQLYPSENGRKGDKKACVKKWEAEGLEARSVEVVKALKKFVKSSKWKELNGQYIPAPLVWLNRGLYDNPPPSDLIPHTRRMTNAEVLALDKSFGQGPAIEPPRRAIGPQTLPEGGSSNGMAHGGSNGK